MADMDTQWQTWRYGCRHGNAQVHMAGEMWCVCTTQDVVQNEEGVAACAELGTALHRE